MQSERRSEPHLHMFAETDRGTMPAEATAAAPRNVASHAEARRFAASRFSLLRLSLMGRLLLVAAASALLWAAVFWALR